MTTTSTIAEQVADYHRASAGQLGILTAPSDGTRVAQLQLGLDLTQVNADGTIGLPMPTVVIADAEGVIRWIDVRADYTTRTELGQILPAVTEMIREIAA